MSDTLMDKFGDLDYPGRTKPKNRDTSKSPPPDTEVWDANPVKYTIGGQVQEFFVISHLAKALGYSVQSIRAWEDKGLLPRSPYRSPTTKGKPQAWGSRKGKRLWTREQILGIVRLAKRHRVIVNRRPPTAAFARDVRVLFSKLTPDE